MKPSTLQRGTLLSLHILITSALVLAFGPWALAFAFLNPNGMSPLLGTSYTKINATTKANLTDQNSKVQEELWARAIVGDSKSLYQTNPFADGMIGGLGSGKAVIQITDTTKVAGKTVNIPTRAGLAGPGVAGEGDRIGAEQKFRIGSFPVSIGRFWFGYGYTGVARDETLIGTYQDAAASQDLREQVAKKKSDDIMMKAIQRAGTSGRNYVLPDGIAARANLTASNVFSTGLISKISGRLTSVGAQPMMVGKDTSGSIFKRYTILGTGDGLRPLKSETAYLDGIKEADTRGAMNALFSGEFRDWDGTGIYRWDNINHANYGSVGSPLLPRAYLGAALDVSGTTTGLEVKGGGSAAAAAILPAPKYFEFFSAAPYTFTNGDTIAAVTNVNRYIKVTNPDGTSAVLKYLVNDGNKITLPASSVTTVSGSTATALVEGALVEECNVGGVVFVRHLGLGQQAFVAGAGSIDGTNGGSGRRTEEIRNHGMDIAVGIEYAWGCEAFKRPDDVYPGFILAETAMPSAA